MTKNKSKTTDWILPFIEDLYLKNRTLVSADNYYCLERIHEKFPIKINRYPTGGDYDTWLIPPQWDVVEAYLSDGENILASYEDHPLFLAPYSKNLEGWVSKEDLLKHTIFDKNNPDSYFYQHRLAANFQLRLKDWGISLPYNVVKNLDKEKYFVKIEVQISSGNLCVGEALLPGVVNKKIALLGHLCHPGQANDGLAGVGCGLEVMRRLIEQKKRHFTYQFLVLPETFGSAVYLSDNISRLDDYLGVLFLEMSGAGTRLAFNSSRKGKLYFDFLLHYLAAKADPGYVHYKFHRGMGNDELNFDWPAINIPGLALYWDEFPQYHSSADRPAIIDPNKIEIMVQIVMDMIGIIEDDYIPVYTQQIPIYQTRYGLYVDAFEERELYNKCTDLLFSIDGRKSVFEITRTLGLDFYQARDYLEKFVDLGFVKKVLLPFNKYQENLE